MTNLINMENPIRHVRFSYSILNAYCLSLIMCASKEPFLTTFTVKQPLERKTFYFSKDCKTKSDNF